MPKISVLTPVYNAANYIEDAINSVLEQSFTDWEMLCVDDESTDNSLSILYEYQKKDKRIKVFSQKNTGPLGARRLAFEHSTGDYIIYLDADDLFSKDLLQCLYDREIESDADAVAPDMLMRFSDKDISWNSERNINISEEMNGVQGFMDTFPWNKLHNFNLWKRSVFEKSTYHPYLENNNFNADEILQRILLLNCKKIVFSAGGAYIHTVCNMNSITRVLSKRSFNRLSANDKLIQLGIDNNLSQNQMERIYGFALFCQLKGLVLDLYRSPKADIDKKWAFSLLKDAYHKYTSHKIIDFYGTSIFDKMRVQIQTINFTIFRLICFLQVKMKH